MRRNRNTTSIPWFLVLPCSLLLLGGMTQATRADEEAATKLHPQLRATVIGAAATLAEEETETEPAPEDDARMVATHQQTAIIKVVEPQGEEWPLNAFCLDLEGNILAGVGEGPGEIRVYDVAGKLQTSWETSVKPEAINIDPAGNVYVGGEGKLLKFDLQHKLILEADAPHAAALKGNAVELRKQVIQQASQRADMYVRQKEVYTQQIERYEKQIKELEAKDDPSEADTQRLSVYKRAIESYRRNIGMFDQYIKQNPAKELTEEQIQTQVKRMVSSKMALSSISATETDVFIACRAQQGYGFAVWRANTDFTGGEQIVSGLSGCCGQMDVQASKDGVFVAENSRKNVRRFDREGEEICKWGTSAREGVLGFGSCCNPMNVAFGPGSEVYTAEATSGRIKRYSTDGEFLGLIGSVEIVPGCKKVSIGVSQDGGRVYMLDITRGHIVVMTRKTETVALAE